MQSYICNCTKPAVGAVNAEIDKKEDKNVWMEGMAGVPSYARKIRSSPKYHLMST